MAGGNNNSSTNIAPLSQNGFNWILSITIPCFIRNLIENFQLIIQILIKLMTLLINVHEENSYISHKSLINKQPELFTISVVFDETKFTLFSIQSKPNDLFIDNCKIFLLQVVSFICLFSPESIFYSYFIQENKTFPRNLRKFHNRDKNFHLPYFVS